MRVVHSRAVNVGHDIRLVQSRVFDEIMRVVVRSAYAYLDGRLGSYNR